MFHHPVDLRPPTMGWLADEPGIALALSPIYRCQSGCIYSSF